MALSVNEISVGAVAYLDPNVLIARSDVEIYGPVVELADGTVGVKPATRGSPFVCVAVNGDVSTWTYLTTREKVERLHIHPAWVQDGYGPLGAGKNWLQDGANSYSMAAAAVVAAAAAESPFAKGIRPRICQLGVRAILTEMQQNAGRSAKYSKS